MDQNQMTSAEQIVYGTELVKHALMRAMADGRDLVTLSRNSEWIAGVFIEYALRNDDEALLRLERSAAGFTPRLVMEGAGNAHIDDDDAYLAYHREQAGGGVDAATWGR